jgi:hypothetical protein
MRYTKKELQERIDAAVIDLWNVLLSAEDEGVEMRPEDLDIYAPISAHPAITGRRRRECRLADYRAEHEENKRLRAAIEKAIEDGSHLPLIGALDDDVEARRG